VEDISLEEIRAIMSSALNSNAKDNKFKKRIAQDYYL
jgi:hypothetical protein